MKCIEARERWHRQFDEGTPDSGLDEHLGSCHSCREYATQMAELGEALDDVREETARIVFRQRPIGTSEPSIVRPGVRRILATLAAAAAITLAFLAYVSNEKREQDPPSKPPIAADAGQAATPALGITLQGDSRDRWMVVAAATGDPQVQLYRLYPRFEAREVRRDSSAPER